MSLGRVLRAAEDRAPHALQRVNVVLCAVVAPVLWLLLYVCLLFVRPNADRLQSQIEVEKQKITRFLQLPEAAASPGCTSRAGLVGELAFFLLDMLLDVSCLSTLIQSKQYVLVACQACVLLFSLAQQLRFGVCAVTRAIIESFKLGYPTDILIRILQAEKLTESFLSMLIQGTAVTTLSNAAATQFNISMLMSMMGIAILLALEECLRLPHPEDCKTSGIGGIGT